MVINAFLLRRGLPWERSETPAERQKRMSLQIEMYAYVAVKNWLHRKEEEDRKNSVLTGAVINTGDSTLMKRRETQNPFIRKHVHIVEKPLRFMGIRRRNTVVMSIPSGTDMVTTIGNNHSKKLVDLW